jgi:hypothetical protein
MPQAAAPPRPRVFCKRQNFREVGLHQCPSERKGEGVPIRSLRIPSHVPSHPQTAAKVRGFSPIASGFTAETDWLLEEDGFELVVPLSKRTAVPSSPFGFPVGGTGYSVLISENDDFEFPAAKVTSLAKRVRRAEWLVHRGLRRNASQVERSAPEVTPEYRLETAEQIAAHGKARAHRTLDRRNVEGQGSRGGPG